MDLDWGARGVPERSGFHMLSGGGVNGHAVLGGIQGALKRAALLTCSRVERGGSRWGLAAAERFIERYEKARLTIQQHPEICRRRANGSRQMPVPRLSFAIFYREAPMLWLVSAGVSTVQDPDVIQAELIIREIREEEPKSSWNRAPRGKSSAG